MNFNKKTENLFVIFCLMAIVAIFLFFGVQHITKFVTADEHYWFQERIPQYWEAISSGKYKKTLVNDKPGVTTAIISGLGLLFEKNTQSHLIKINDDIKIYDTKRTENINAAFRYPLLIFNGLFIIFFFWIIFKITANKWIALWSSAFIGLSPIIIGISQIVNPDSLLWTFSCAGIFSYFALLKQEQKKYVILTAIFTGLAILSKYTANILFPFYFLLLLVSFIANKKNTNSSEIKKYFKLQLSNYLLIIVGSLAVIVVFLPAVFIKPIYLYRLTMGFSEMKIIFGLIFAAVIAIHIDLQLLNSKISLLIKKIFSRKNSWVKFITFILLVIFLALIIGRNIFIDWKLFDAIPFDIKKISYTDNIGYYPNIFELFLLEFNSLVFSLTPIVILFTIFVWVQSIISKKYHEYNFYIFSVTFFIFIYFVASMASDVVSIVRYSIILYPLFAFLAAIGLWSIYDLWLKKIYLDARIILTIAIIGISVSSLFFIKPFYFNYANFLLPKNKIISDAWGYGGYEAAEYLNSLPNAEKLTVWSDYYGVCEFFKGTCITEYNFVVKPLLIDYYILTRRGEIRYNSNWSDWSPDNGVKATEYYKNPDPLWHIYIDDRPENFIKIYKNSQ